MSNGLNNIENNAKKNEARISYLIINLTLFVLGLLEWFIFSDDYWDPFRIIFLILMITLPCHILVALNIKRINIVYWVYGLIHLVLAGVLGVNAIGNDEKIVDNTIILMIIYLLTILITFPICFFAVRTKRNK
jgi:hypothetical protein